MITNADMTIYNVKTNKQTRLPEYFPTEITGVHWYTDQKVQVDEKGLNSADMYKIRIPEGQGISGKRYVPPSEYAAMMDISGVWTIQNGDLFVRGTVADQITKASELLEKYPDTSGKVVSWSDNRFGSQPHWRIGGTR